MPWPFDPLTTYIATTPPAIKAFDLNAFQAAINDLYKGHPFFGDGADGAYSQSSGTTIFTANKYFTTCDLLGTAVLVPDGHVITASHYIRLRNDAFINEIGGSGIDNSITPGAGAGSSGKTLGNGGADGGAGNGAVGVAGGSRLQTSMGGSGGAGGAGGGGGAGLGGAGGLASLNAQLEARSLIALLNGYLIGHDGTTHGIFPITPGAGGGGGGQAGGTGNDGLGGGGGGGIVILCAPVIDIGAGTSIHANGGGGGKQVGGAAGDNGGGGGGGGGGVIILVCAQLIENGVIEVTGGAGGTAPGQGTGGNGGTGTIIRRILTT